MPAESDCHPGKTTPGLYRPRRPAGSVLHCLEREELETFLALARQPDPDFDPVSTHVERTFRKYLACGILAHGFARVQALVRQRVLGRLARHGYLEDETVAEMLAKRHSGGFPWTLQCDSRRGIGRVWSGWRVTAGARVSAAPVWID